MGQAHVYEFLKNKRCMGIDKYYSAKEIKDEIKLSYNCVVADCFRLQHFGYLEAQTTGSKTRPDGWHRRFRLKLEYTKKDE